MNEDGAREGAEKRPASEDPNPQSKQLEKDITPNVNIDVEEARLNDMTRQGEGFEVASVNPQVDASDREPQMSNKQSFESEDKHDPDLSVDDAENPIEPKNEEFDKDGRDSGNSVTPKATP